MLQQTLLLLPSHVVRIFSMPVLLRIDDNVASRTSRFLVSFLLRLINENSRFKSAFECGKHSMSFTPHSQVLGTGAYLSVLLTYVPPYMSMQWNSALIFEHSAKCHPHWSAVSAWSPQSEQVTSCFAEPSSAGIILLPLRMWWHHWREYHQLRVAFSEWLLLSIQDQVGCLKGKKI